MKTILLFFLLLIFRMSAQAQTTSDSTLIQLLNKGDSLFTQNRYWEDLTTYNKICEIDSSRCPEEKIALTKETGKTVICYDDSEWCKLLDAADKRFQQKDYAMAREFYRRANSIRKSDEYSKKQIELIDLLINNQ